MEYNTAEIRRIAARLSSLAFRISDSAGGSLRSAVDELPSRFRGAAADEMKTSLINLRSDLQAEAQAVRRLSNILYTYAKQLDEADEKASRNIKEK